MQFLAFKKVTLSQVILRCLHKSKDTSIPWINRLHEFSLRSWRTEKKRRIFLVFLLLLLILLSSVSIFESFNQCKRHVFGLEGSTEVGSENAVRNNGGDGLFDGEGFGRKPQMSQHHGPGEHHGER